MPPRTLRLRDDLDALVRVAAASRKQTVAAWLTAAIQGAVLMQAARKTDGQPLAAALDRMAPMS